MKQFARLHNLAWVHVDTTQRGRGSMVIICTLCVTAFQEKDPFFKSALHQNRRIVFAFLGQEPEGRPLFAFFAKADSHHHVCLDGVAISMIVVAGARGGRI